MRGSGLGGPGCARGCPSDAGRLRATMQKSVRYNEGHALYLALLARKEGTKRGYLSKKAAEASRWHDKWFALYQNVLFYFESEQSARPAGMYMLEGCSCERAPVPKGAAAGSAREAALDKQVRGGGTPRDPPEAAPGSVGTPLPGGARRCRGGCGSGRGDERPEGTAGGGSRAMCGWRRRGEVFWEPGRPVPAPVPALQEPSRSQRVRRAAGRAASRRLLTVVAGKGRGHGAASSPSAGTAAVPGELLTLLRARGLLPLQNLCAKAGREMVKRAPSRGDACGGSGCPEVCSCERR